MSQTRRGHLPYGYKIENGIAVVCEEEAAQLQKMYEGYLGGLSLIEAAAQVPDRGGCAGRPDPDTRISKTDASESPLPGG